jgi:intein/homing endonuclease
LSENAGQELESKLAWPPTKKDLIRLYVEQRLSTRKIAKVYGLKYASEKTAESTVLYHLKRNGIGRRDSAEHIRKVKEEMVDEWVRRYAAGESLKQIARDLVDPVTVFMHLKKRGVHLRDRIEAQIEAVSKYERRPFKGDSLEKAYLTGLRYGDLNVVRHGRAIRVRLSTTHPAMAELFESLFSGYGHVSNYPRRAKLVGYEYSLESDLNDSFQFLLSKPTIRELEALSKEEVIAFLAGLFDAEGSVYLHNKRGRRNPEVFYSNTEPDLLEYVAAGLRMMGLNPKLAWIDQRLNRNGVEGASRVGRVHLFRFREVQEFLRALPVRHPEKTAKSKLILGVNYRASESEHSEFVKKWEKLSAQIASDRDAFVESARRAIESKRESGCSEFSLVGRDEQES